MENSWALLSLMQPSLTGPWLWAGPAPGSWNKEWMRQSPWQQVASVLVDNSTTSTTNNLQSVYNQQTSVCILICPWEAVKRRKRQSVLGENHQGRVLSKGGTWAETRREWGSEPCDASEEEWGPRPQGRNELAMFEMVKKPNTAEEKEKRGRARGGETRFHRGLKLM